MFVTFCCYVFVIVHVQNQTSSLLNVRCHWRMLGNEQTGRTVSEQEQEVAENTALMDPALMFRTPENQPSLS